MGVKRADGGNGPEPAVGAGPEVPRRGGGRRRGSLRLALGCLVLLPVAAYVAIAGAMYAFQERIVFVPAKATSGDPSAAGMVFEDLRLRAPDGISIHAWFAPAAGQRRGAALFCHGNGGNISRCLPRIRALRELGLNVLVFDYRGYGWSEGAPTESGLYLDVRAAWDWLVNEKGLRPRDIVLWGHSLGTSVA